ncbi:phosphate transporter [Rhizoclosmatium globosum]|uniref:Phosphate transporter n=1 Tax=Rhizoclosmatium globosum TaxID=329046 RepID=A0A1Y2D2Q7_9FUNG|nr:phosphate transporter [Rhizoclosmatium globosum]|eukprot:ORY53578.1 phosphate transporter [Rhizoclosmatium globosum]
MAPIALPVNSYTWMFALTVGFAFLDAYAIGANDVANSFATSVGSRSLKLWQACCIAIFTEFLGAIRSWMFDTRQDLLMAGFMCALIGSSSWVMFATRFGWPVSTTHSIVGAIIGVGISAFGSDAVNWGWGNKGVLQIVASWLVSPAVAGILAVIIYGLTLYFTVTTFIVSFFVVSKNGKSTLKISADYFGAPLVVTGDLTLCMAIVGGITGFVLLFTVLFAVPYFIRRLEKEEDLKAHHIFYIFAVPTQPKNEDLERQLALQFTPHLVEDGQKEPVVLHTEKVSAVKAAGDTTDAIGIIDTFKNGLRGTYELASKGLFLDVAGIQSANAKDAHAHATLYDNKVEFLFSFLQVMTASFASFSHGSNDVANAIGPLAAVYDLWSTGKVAKNANVQTWMLAMGGFAIDLGLALYGWRVMINLGNNLTYHSPSRGFSMELGAALSVITASFLALPVSTTQCIVGATIGVGLMNGNLKSVNWKMVSWTLFSWVLTLPIAGVSAGCLFAFVTRGPSFNAAPVA